jgi:tetratricopeptide (TPR) repeat protein
MKSMRSSNHQFVVWVLSLVLLSLACNHAIPHFGIGGHYEEGKEQFLRGRGGDMEVAITALETVVSQDPTYKDSLTYLGRAYYRTNKFQPAYAILQRALIVNKDDEMAWMAFGVTQLRLGQLDAGIESLKGGLTLASKAMVNGYQNFLYFDTRGLIHAQIRRSAFLVTKGIEEKDNIISSTDRLMLLVDDEVNAQRNTRIQNTRPLYGNN